MKAVDLFAAALAAQRGTASEEDEARIARDAQDLAEAVCNRSGHDWAEHAYRCERCGADEPREVVVSESSFDR